MKYAKENFESGKMISKSLWNEILLYLSLQRQISKAFGMVGVKNYSGTVVKVERSKTSKSLPRIDATTPKKKYWNVSSIEELLELMAIFHLENH